MSIYLYFVDTFTHLHTHVRVDVHIHVHLFDLRLCFDDWTIVIKTEKGITFYTLWYVRNYLYTLTWSRLYSAIKSSYSKCEFLWSTLLWPHLYLLHLLQINDWVDLNFLFFAYCNQLKREYCFACNHYLFAISFANT